MEDRDLTEPVTTTRPGLEEETKVFGDSKHFVVSGRGPAPNGFDYDWADVKHDADLWRYLNEKKYAAG